MKRSLIIGMLLPLFYTQVGYYGQFIWLQWRIKVSAREAWIAALPDAAFVRIDKAVVDANGNWEDRGKECSLNGHMYDVIRSGTIGGVTWLFCVDDENEERLDRQSGQVFRTDQEHPDKKTAHSLSLSLADILCERPGWSVPAPASALRQYIVVITQPLVSHYPENAGPPPKA